MVSEGVELRHLLNAAWQARVDPDRDPERDLNAAVKTLQDKFNRAHRERNSANTEVNSTVKTTPGENLG